MLLRYLNIQLTRESNITTGKIYKYVIVKNHLKPFSSIAVNKANSNSRKKSVGEIVGIS